MSRESFGDSYVESDFKALDKLVENLGKKHYVDVGILGQNAGKTEGGGATVGMIGAVHEFGTVIDHPGGTSYVIGDNGKATFVKKGTSGITGVTKPHDIPIPARSFIRVPLQTHQAQIQKEVEPRMQKHMEEGDIKGIFTDIGIAAEGVIQDAFDTGGFGAWPDIKQSTKNDKGSDSILINHGLLRKSISSKAGAA